MSNTEQGIPRSRTILGDKTITLSAALEEENDMLEHLALDDHATEFADYFAQNQSLVADVIARQTRASLSEVFLEGWIWGSFNASISAQVRSKQRLFIRFPLPFKIGERHFLGNADEKVKCEAATYAWISENSPDVPIPKLIGYGLSDGRCFTVLDNIPLPTRLFHTLRRYIRKWAGCATPCRYVAHGRSGLAHPYLLIENIETDGSRMLSESWKEHRQDTRRRKNLFRDLARIMLSVGRVPQARIGSFTIDDGGYLSLTNRPLLMQLNQLENEGIDTGIARSDVYTNTVPFALDLIQFHDNYLRQQPNAVKDGEDGRFQMATFTCMRTVLPHFFPKARRNGPFALTLMDMHQSNLFVDEDWHIRGVIDLEYAMTLPMEMQLTPYWLSDQDLDGLRRDSTEFDRVHEEFINVYRDEERTRSDLTSPRAELMNMAWRTKSFFYYHALQIRTGSVNVFNDCIRPLYVNGSVDGYNRCSTAFWAVDSEEILARKVKDRERYTEHLRAQFVGDTG